MHNRVPIALRLFGGLAGVVAGALIGFIVSVCLMVTISLTSALPSALIGVFLGDGAYKVTVESQQGRQNSQELLVARRIGDCQ